LKVGLSWHDDIRSLHDRGEFESHGFIDLQDHMKEIGVEDMSLVKLYANLFGERISKTERLSNWERDVLKPAQQTYAAIDAWACIRLYEELMRLKDTGDYILRDVQTELEVEEEFELYEKLAAEKR
jgi:ribonuclease D